MRDVAGVNHEGRLLRQRSGLGDRFFERGQRIRIRRLLEADMAVGNLQERKAARRLGVGGRYPEHRRSRDAARHRPQQSGPGPDHALQRAAPVDTALVFLVWLVLCHGSLLHAARTADCMKDGWRLRLIPGTKRIFGQLVRHNGPRIHRSRCSALSRQCGRRAPRDRPYLRARPHA